MSDRDDSGLPLELEAQQIAQNATLYRGSAPCPQCGHMMNPIEAMHGGGVCSSCKNKRAALRVKGMLQ